MAVPVAVATMPAAAADHDAWAAVGVVIAVAAWVIVTAATIVRAGRSDADSAHADVNAECHCWRCGGEHRRHRDCERKFLHKQLSSGLFLAQRKKRTRGKTCSMARPPSRVSNFDQPPPRPPSLISRHRALLGKRAKQINSNYGGECSNQQQFQFGR